MSPTGTVLCLTAVLLILLAIAAYFMLTNVPQGPIMVIP
jgi:hypothetical protein